MTTRAKGLARRSYRVLLRAYPQTVRERDGREMEETFLSILRWEGERRGLTGKANAWMCGMWDALAGGVAMRLRRGTGSAGRGGPDRNHGNKTGMGQWNTNYNK